MLERLPFEPGCVLESACQFGLNPLRAIVVPVVALPRAHDAFAQPSIEDRLENLW